jgi:hypothetical protein
LSTVEAVRAARGNLQELLGRPIEAILGVEREGGRWVVKAQVVELRRIPNTTDVLGEYEALMDGSGEVVRYARTRRYNRGHVDGGAS